MAATTTPHRRSAPRAFGAARTAVVVAALAAVGFVAVVDPLGGTVLIALTGRHGVDIGDVVVVPLVVLAAHVSPQRRGAPRRPPRVAAPSTLPVAVLAAELLALGGVALVDGTASRLDRAVDAVVSLGVVATAGWLVLSWRRSGGARSSVRHLVAPVPLALFAIGLAVDVLMTPTGTVWSSTLVAAWATVAVGGAAARAVFGAAAVAGVTANVASTADLAGVDVTMSASQGGCARAAALGALLFAAIVPVRTPC